MSGRHFLADGNELSVSFNYFNVSQDGGWGRHGVEGPGGPEGLCWEGSRTAPGLRVDWTLLG